MYRETESAMFKASSSYSFVTMRSAVCIGAYMVVEVENATLVH